MENTDYPLSLLKSLKSLLLEFKKLVFQNEDIINQVVLSNSIIYLEYKKSESFYFSISKPNMTADFRSFFNFSYLPQDENLYKKASYNNDMSVVLEHFSNWISLLREYDEIKLNEDDVLTKFYEDEFFHEFEILDDDAFTSPFEHQRQIILYNFLNSIELHLKDYPETDPDIAMLIDEVENIKNNIQNFTKNAAMKKLASFLAKVKKKGLKLFLDIVKDAAKEIVVKALTGKIEEVIIYIHHTF